MAVNINTPASSQQTNEPNQSSSNSEANRAAWAQVKIGVITAIFTFVLAICTVVIAGYSVYQGYQLRQTLLITNRPRLKIRHLVVDGFEPNGHIGTRLTNCFLWVTNVGVLPAIVLRVHTQWLFADNLPLANPVLEVLDTSTIPVKMEPSSVRKIRVEDREITPEEFIRINNDVDQIGMGFGERPGTLFLVGYIKYRDDIGIRRMYFCQQYDPLLRRFVKISHPNYNYID